MKATTCDSCGATIIWAVTTTGERMAVDAEPVKGGNVLLVGDEWAAPTAKVIDMWTFVKEPQLQSLPRYVAHLTTCPGARKRRRR